MTLGIPKDLDETTVAVSDTSPLRRFSAALEDLVRDSEKYAVGDLETKLITAQLKFYVKEGISIGAGREFEVLPLTLSAGDAITTELTQSITLTIALPEDS